MRMLSQLAMPLPDIHDYRPIIGASRFVTGHGFNRQQQYPQCKKPCFPIECSNIARERLPQKRLCITYFDLAGTSIKCATVPDEELPDIQTSKGLGATSHWPRRL